MTRRAQDEMSVCDDNENRTLPQTEEILFYLGFHNPVLWNMGILNKLLGNYNFMLFIYLLATTYLLLDLSINYFLRLVLSCFYFLSMKEKSSSLLLLLYRTGTLLNGDKQVRRWVCQVCETFC